MKQEAAPDRRLPAQRAFVGQVAAAEVAPGCDLTLHAGGSILYDMTTKTADMAIWPDTTHTALGRLLHLRQGLAPWEARRRLSLSESESISTQVLPLPLSRNIRL